MCSCPARSGAAHERARFACSDSARWGRRSLPTCALASDGITAWDLKFAESASAPTLAAGRLGVLAAADARSAVAEADVVISAVTAAQIGEAARSVAAHLKRDAYYFDLNSTSPAAKQAAAASIDAAGGRFVEAAIMSPIAPRRAASPMLLGGAHAASFLPLATQLGFTGAQVFSEKLGAASAAKMCRSVVVKGLEALMLESLADRAQIRRRAGGARLTAVDCSRGRLAHAGAAT